MVTNKQIAGLRDAAGCAGDLEQVEWCDRALQGDAVAWEVCEHAILDAAGRAEEIVDDV